MSAKGKTGRAKDKDDDDVYDYAYRLANAIKLTGESAKIIPADKKLISDFLNHLQAKRVSDGRMAKYCHTVRKLVENIGVPVQSATRSDIETVSIWIQKQRYTSHTVSDYIFTLKYFYKFVRSGNTDRETPFPEEVRWLKSRAKLNERRDPVFYTPAEAEALVRSAATLRDKCMFSLAFERGMRPSELLLLRVGDVSLDERGARVRIWKGKTGERTIRIIASASLLARYLETHPLRTDLEAPLWVTDSTNRKNRRLGWAGWNRIIKETAKKAGIMDKRKWHHYPLRHGSATEASRFMSDSELKALYGWTMGSQMTAVYVHLSAKDMDAKLESLYSGKPVVQPTRPEFCPTICVKCSEKNAPGLNYCGRCGAPLSQAELARSAAEEQMLRNELQDVKRQVSEMLKKTGTARPSPGTPGSAQGQSA